MKQGARTTAAKAIQDVCRGHSLDRALKLHQQRVDESQRALTAELAYGVCRWHVQLEALLGLLLNKRIKSSKQIVEQLIKVGLYQLYHMRIPEHAAVDQTVKAVSQLGEKWAVKLVNGVLRRAQRERDLLLEKVASDPVAACGLPTWLYVRLKQQQPERLQVICEALLQRPPMTLRVNRLAVSVSDYAMRLAEMGITSRLVTGVPQALVLDKPNVVDKLPGFRDGHISVQDAGAQLAATLLAPQPGDYVLDACAAPGGKTTHLLEVEPASRLTAVDIDAQRLARVQENLERLSLTAELIIDDVSAPQGAWTQNSYDRILLDVPCSATGVIRRHPDIRLLRRESDIQQLVILQRKILNQAWQLLKPGGRLLYTTCSLLAEENWLQVERFLYEQNDAVACEIRVEHVDPVKVGVQTMPGRASMDGFYYALLAKCP